MGGYSKILGTRPLHRKIVQMSPRKRNSIAEKIRNERRKLIRRIDKLKKSEAPNGLISSLENIVKSSYLRTNKKRGIIGTSVSGAIANLAEGLRLEDKFNFGEDFKILQNELVNSEWNRGAKGQTSVYKQGAIDLFYASLANVSRDNDEIIKYLEDIANKKRKDNEPEISFSNIGEAYEFWLKELSEKEGFNYNKFEEDMETMSSEEFYKEYGISLTKIYYRG